MENQTKIKAKSKVSSGKRYKCPMGICEERFPREKLADHIDKKHKSLIPEGSSAAREAFNAINHKTHGTCVICKKESPWNENKCRYDRFCSRACASAYEKQFAERLQKARGVTRSELLNDPEQQNKMLAGRSISGVYTFSDGTKRNYVGSYEKAFLEFMDVYFQIDPVDLEQPGPVIPYTFRGQSKQWITDFYYAPYNLVFDIKDGGDNPNNREMPEYREKQYCKEHAIETQGVYNYVRLTNNEFDQMIEFMMELKLGMLEGDTTPMIRINK